MLNSGGRIYKREKYDSERDWIIQHVSVDINSASYC